MLSRSSRRSLTLAALACPLLTAPAFAADIAFTFTDFNLEFSPTIQDTRGSSPGLLGSDALGQAEFFVDGDLRYSDDTTFAFLMTDLAAPTVGGTSTGSSGQFDFYFGGGLFGDDRQFQIQFNTAQGGGLSASHDAVNDRLLIELTGGRIVDATQRGPAGIRFDPNQEINITIGTNVVDDGTQVTGFIGSALFADGNGSGSVIPEPASLTMLGLGALLLMRRRRA